MNERVVGVGVQFAISTNAPMGHTWARKCKIFLIFFLGVFLQFPPTAESHVSQTNLKI